MTITLSKRNAWILGSFLLTITIIALTIMANPGGAEATEQSDSKAAEIISKNSPSAPLDASDEKQSSVMGAVDVDVEPIAMAGGESTVFSVWLNTHSVELDFDFTKIIYLTDDQSNRYEAVEWTGNRGWHHVSGDIIFPPLDDNATEITLHISTIENTTASFTWPIGEK